MNSFPSGHSQAAFAAMTALLIIFPRHAALWLTIAVLVALSRVVTTVHYLSDAVAGSWLAICVTVALARAFRARGWEPRIGRAW
jgi:membrane-associated phospholipid phosphatase